MDDSVTYLIEMRRGDEYRVAEIEELERPEARPIHRSNRYTPPSAVFYSDANHDGLALTVLERRGSFS
jgi:hypothetical protein